MLTFDKNIRFQQNFGKSPILVAILMGDNNTYMELTKLSPLVRKVLKKQKRQSGPVAIYEGMSI